MHLSPRFLPLFLVPALSILAPGCGHSEEEWQAQLEKYNRLDGEHKSKLKELEEAQLKVADLEKQLRGMGVDIQDRDMDERMHTTPWYWTTHEPMSTTHRDHGHMHDVGLPNCRPENLVQMGIGGWYGSRPGAIVAQRRGTSVMTMTDITDLGPKKAAEMALELAWKGCKAVYLSFDIDSIDPGFAPGTGSPEPGGLLPREALEIVRTHNERV